MQLLVRWGWDNQTLILSALLIGVCTPVLSAEVLNPSAPDDQNDDQNAVYRIMVNSDLGRLTDCADITTLPDALAQAAGDPRINVIEFDPILFTDHSAVIKLAEPIVIEGKRPGRDCIDGSAVRNGITLDLSSCPDAGIIIGSGGELTLPLVRSIT